MEFFDCGIHDSMSIEENFISTPPMSKIASFQIIYKKFMNNTG